MEIFVTGATGLVGNSLSKKLLENGAHVKALARSPQKIRHLGLFHENLSVVPGSLSHKASLVEGMKGCKQVYHLAAIAGVWAPDNGFHKVNVLGTQNIMDAALEAGVEKVVITSTAGVIGPTLSGPVNEDTDRIVPFFNEYEETKAEAQELALSYQEKGLEVVAVAPTRVFGPGPMGISNATSKIIQQYLSRLFYFRPGDGTSTGNYVYIPDLVDGHIKAMEKGRSGELYLLGGEDLSWNGLFEIVGDLTGKRLPMVTLPFKLLMTYARMQQFAAENFGRRPSVTPEWVKRYDYNWKVSSQKAINELGYHITPAEEAFRATIDWLKTLD